MLSLFFKHQRPTSTLNWFFLADCASFADQFQQICSANRIIMIQDWLNSFLEYSGAVSRFT